MMVGKEENSSVEEVFSATIMINSAKRIFRVKKISSMNGGKGKISMVKIHTITTGIANDCHGMSSDNCRRSDNVKELDAISLKNPVCCYKY
jgi:hypothetical protein